MTEPDPKFNPRRFRTTVPYYARYRLGYPDGLIARVVALAGLQRGDSVMDLGCGPGLLAVPFARAGMRVTAVDPEPDMLAEAGEAAAEAGVKIELKQGSSYALPEGIGPFRLVTMGRAFHWMDREATLKLLDTRIVPGGAVALFDDDHPKTAENIWRRILRDLGNQYGRESSPHLLEAGQPDYRSHESWLLTSPFHNLERCSVIIRRKITADEIVGLAYSLSTTSPEKLGERAARFENELRTALAEQTVDGTFTEIAELSALIATRSGSSA
jgi:SAM-dependent methyltransferase